VHTVIFGGFSAEAIKDRINDCKAKLVITADGGWRRGKVIELKANVDRAVAGTPTVQTVLVVKRCGNAVNMVEGRDVWWKEAWEGRAEQAHREGLRFRAPRSSSSIRPAPPANRRACCTLPPAICSVPSLTSHYVFDLKETDRYFCSADIGWNHRPQLRRLRPALERLDVFLYEGAPNQPEPDRFWQMIEPSRPHHPLHGADRHPRVHALGRQLRPPPPPRFAAPARLRRRGPSTPRRGCGITP